MKYKKGDLLWSQYYSRLGVVSRITTDGDYSVDDPGYVLADVCNPNKEILFGVREMTRTPDGIFALIKLQDGYSSAAGAQS